MKVYVNPDDFKCHTENDGTCMEYDVPFFDGKCQTFIEGYRYVPPGESWTGEDGEVFNGEMIAPWADYAELDAAQREYEREQLAEYESALAEIEVALGV